jgi:hypothetical protein
MQARALEMAEATLGPQHAVVATYLGNMAQVGAGAQRCAVPELWVVRGCGPT